ncbi:MULTISPECIES: DUF6443 domain-containing protein [Chryseobacterium]|uniref:RHS repeat-associated protein n=2 Tax=Chryseobacterium TaxID=59732 RepID=A0ABU0TKX3_9FLAO|nr:MULTISPECIES: DUF6443 domain-containing protein [Chryseobacterium]MDQ1097684.1 RHS repeat-associated protein [Chryseobacterium camelliae]MDR6085056.1 RHS repeat-associated protein [Chryseobacterium sp. SORGH_AS_0909]MDR6129411.1 RHS repeat-associated protein [Chryseobacterium sp. SORGH_AS_1175]MDT3408460.1 RHS repeat-associated protein [Pseudacidovorax intermedius]
MRKHIITTVLSVFSFFWAGAAFAQTSAENYVQSKTCLNADCSKISETITYFDGLGRPKQIVSVKITPTGKDLVTPITYDGFGRQVKDILPVPVTTQNSNIHSSITSENAANTYYGVSNAFAEKEIENSPLDRVKQVAAPGEPWKLQSGHTRKYQYEANAANEVRKFVTSTSVNTVNGVSNTVSALSISSDNSGYYPAAVLYKNTETDEDGNPVVTFRNGNDQTLLIRRNDGSQNIDTYYVYNEYDQLAFIIPPKAVEQISQNGNSIASSVLDELCYQYRYDGKDREVEKHIPGKDWEYTVYDKQDRVVLTQDGVLRGTANNFGSKGWIFTKYDEFGRVVYTGFFSNTASRQAMQNALNSMAANPYNNEKRSSSSFTLQGQQVFYDKQAFPTGSMTLLTVNYYDTYPAEINAIPAQVLGEYTLQQSLTTSEDPSTKSLLTASFVKNIEDDNWTRTYHFYDTRGRIIRTKTDNHFGGHTNYEYKLNFSGQPLEKYTYHQKSASDPEVLVKERFIYDDQERLVQQYHQFGNNPEELLAENTYNDLGQLVNKKTGNQTGTSLQSVDYTYNIRGWLSSMNNPNSAAGNGKLFGYELKFEKPSGNSPADPRFNGNISEFDWKTTNDNILKRYAYEYDRLDRMKNAFYLEPEATTPVNNAFSEFVTYDTGGNIQTLKRYRKFNTTPILVDDLNYQSYLGNQLHIVTDASGNGSGYPLGGNNMEYDPNGNMTSHPDKGIENISYNFLNLPRKVTFQESVPNFKPTLSFLYRADGVKVRKSFIYYEPSAASRRTENTDYLDGFQYVDDVLQFFPTSEGYYDVANSRYVYNYLDQVGNVRVAYYRDAYNSVIADRETNYYPFGLEYPFSWVWTQQYNYRYGFQGQEKQIETGWSSFKWRNSIPELGRFFNIDPLSEDYHDWSVYAFSGNRVVDSRELEGLEPKKVTEVSLPDDPTEFAEMIGGGINSLRSSVSNLSARAYNVLISDRVRNKYEVDESGYLNLVTGVPKETKKEKIVNTIGDLATIGLAAIGGPEGMLTAQGTKPTFLRAFESVRAYQKNEARAARLNKVDRSGMDFTKAGKQVVIKRNEIKYGKVKCERCGVATTPAKQSKKGIVPKKTETQVDHIKRRREGGRGNPDNGQVYCRKCNLEKH